MAVGIVPVRQHSPGWKKLGIACFLGKCYYIILRLLYRFECVFKGSIMMYRVNPVLVLLGSLLAAVPAHSDSKSDKSPAQFRLRQILVVPAPSPDHDSQVYARAVDCLNRAKNGADFTALAKKYSQEPGAERTGGDLGFFTADQMVSAFSEIVFSMKTGEVRGPVRTEYGYHIIKLLEIRGKQRRAQHILFTLIPSGADSMAAFRTVSRIWNQLQNGADYDDMCQKYNQNEELKATDGYMVWQKPDEMLDEFVKAVSGLKPGEYSQPFSSILGFHIVMVDSINYDSDHILQGFPAFIEHRLKEQKSKLE
jgi:peptidyl-prolyl cis-trans isomerase SurA